MAKKRITLVKDFNDIVKSGDMIAFKAVFDKCDINATSGYSKNTALHSYSLTDEMIRWLIENGADINAVNTYGSTPLDVAVSLRNGKIGAFIELGANVKTADTYGDTPLHSAAGCGFNLENVKLLIDNGADVLARNKNGQTPLEYALARANNSDIVDVVDVAQFLLTIQTSITEEMKQNVIKIGERFEFYRPEYNKEFLPQTEAALERLYELFHVEPVAKRKVFDGTSKIEIKANTWKKQFNELWELLVPGQGHASTVQGEVIRICGKVSSEILDNGAINWDKGYKKLPQSLPQYFALGNPLEHSAYAEAERLAKGISANSDETALYRLSEFAVKWVIANPTPIALTKVDYER